MLKMNVMNLLISLQRSLEVAALFLVICFMSACTVMQNSPLDEQRAQEMVDRGVSFLRTASYEQAEASFRVAAELAQIPAAYDGLACVHFLRGNVLEAKSLYKKIISWFPSYARSRANLALIYDLEGQSSAAAALYEDALSLEPLNYKVRNNYGALLLNSKNHTARSAAKSYLIDAQVIADHPIIRANIETIRYNYKE